MLRVSPLKVRVFGTCRLRYQYQYLEPQTKARLRPADTAGSLVHRVLCDFFSKLPPDERSAATLERMFEEGWAALSPRYHRVPGVEKHRQASLQQLRNFARHFDLSARAFMVEPYFQAEMSPGVVIFGRVDRIDEEPDGSLHIIDYKGGQAADEIDAGQLKFYAIMAEEKLRRIVSRLSFWYLDDGQAWAMDFTQDDRRRTHEEMLATIQDMQTAKEFPATIAPHCSYCPYLHACAHREEIIERRLREGW